jgi:response regulator RpfG family c-di-GMP phosphodiesterase
MLQRLLAAAVIRQEDWDRLTAKRREELQSLPDAATLLAQLIELKLLTEYQVSNLAASKNQPGSLPLHGPGSTLDADAVTPRPYQVLVVDDEPMNRNLCRMVLTAEGIVCDEAHNGEEALAAVQRKQYDLVLLDIDMPRMSGTEVLRLLRASPPSPHLKIVMLSGRASGDEMAQMLSTGADDYLTKPFSLTQLTARIKAALNLKTAQDRSDLLAHLLLTMNHELDQSLHARDSDLVEARNALVLALAELVAYRDVESGSHLMRLQHYSRMLGEQAAAQCPSLTDQLNMNFIQLLACCAPLHDIGKVGLPDHILLKPGKLAPDERVIMQTHTTIGAAVLQKVARQHGFAATFLQMAIDIARHHHERYDGAGYPDRLAGDSIPLAARIVAIGDVYDALRSRRCYKPALSHQETLSVMTQTGNGHFDPVLFQVFLQNADKFDKLYQELAD